MVWARKGREPLIEEERVVAIEWSIRSSSLEKGAVLDAIGMMSDNIRVAASIPVRIADSEFVQQGKDESSHLLNRGQGQVGQDWFRWRPQYGVVWFGKHSLTEVIAYAPHQRTHHSANRLWPLLEITELARQPDWAIVSSPERAS